MDSKLLLNFFTKASKNMEKEIAELEKQRDSAKEQDKELDKRFYEITSSIVAPYPPTLMQQASVLESTLQKYRAGLNSILDNMKEEDRKVEADYEGLERWRSRIDNNLRNSMGVDKYTLMPDLELQSEYDTSLITEEAELTKKLQSFFDNDDKNKAEEEQIKAAIEQINLHMREIKNQKELSKIDPLEIEKLQTEIAELDAEIQKYKNEENSNNKLTEGENIQNGDEA